MPHLFAHTYSTSLPGGTGKRRLEVGLGGHALVSYGIQNIGLSNRKLKSGSAEVQRVTTMHASPRQTDRQTDERTSWQ